MSLSHHLRRRSSAATTFLRRFSTTTPATTTPSPPPSDEAQPPHEFLPPNKFISSWSTPSNPREAKRQLTLLHRQYAKQMKQVRKNFIHEMEVQRLEKMRKDEAKKEAMRIDAEAKKAAKEAKKKDTAHETELAKEELRQTLLKERAEKLEYWRAREKMFEERKKAKRELIRQRSSMWIGEAELEKKLLENVVETTSL